MLERFFENKYKEEAKAEKERAFDLISQIKKFNNGLDDEDALKGTVIFFYQKIKDKKTLDEFKKCVSQPLEIILSDRKRSSETLLPLSDLQALNEEKDEKPVSMERMKPAEINVSPPKSLSTKIEPENVKSQANTLLDVNNALNDNLTSQKSEKETASRNGFFKSPRDMQLNSIDFLSRKDLVNTAIVSKEFRELTFDAMSDEAVLYQALAKGQKIINEEKELDPWLKETLSGQSGLLALGKELITMSQAKQMANYELRELMTDEGLVALQEKLITVDQIIQMRSIGRLEAFLSPSGMIALREKLITVEQAIQMPIWHLDAFLTPSGMIALREKLITVEQANQMPIRRVDALLSPNGVIALREGLMTVSQANQFDSYELPQVLALEVERAARNNHAPGL